MKVIISIHDVYPLFQKEIEIILKELKDVKISLLITPCWNQDSSPDMDYFKTLADEDLVLHGLTHKTNKKDFFGNLLLMSKSSCKEFYGLNEIETRNKVENASKIFEATFGRKPAGFIPPMWYHNRYSVKVLRDLGFAFTESEVAFMDLRRNQNTFSIPACFDFGNNKLLSRAALSGWRYVFKHLRQSLLRISIHPSDVRNGFLPDILQIIKWLQSKEYQFMLYIDFY
jgi:predicted deacetylase